jgi:hypothetical protein
MDLGTYFGHMTHLKNADFSTGPPYGVGDVGALISGESCSVRYPNLPQILYGVESHPIGSSVGL